MPPKIKRNPLAYGVGRATLAIAACCTIQALVGTALAQTAPAAQRAAVEVRQSRPVIATPEEQISQLQDQVKELKARLAALEKKFAQHRHEVPVTEVGMLSEPINGRRVSLAISPRSGKGKSGPPVE